MGSVQSTWRKPGGKLRRLRISQGMSAGLRHAALMLSNRFLMRGISDSLMQFVAQPARRSEHHQSPEIEYHHVTRTNSSISITKSIHAVNITPTA